MTFFVNPMSTYPEHDPCSACGHPEHPDAPCPQIVAYARPYDFVCDCTEEENP